MVALYKFLGLQTRGFSALDEKDQENTISATGKLRVYVKKVYHCTENPDNNSITQFIQCSAHFQ
jgi:hypothetical protein